MQEGQRCLVAEERQRLDYNAPLLSIRRLNEGAGQQPRGKFYKISSELSKESLRIPGAVPFGWEQTPGRCKPKPDLPAMQPQMLFPARLSPQRSLRSAAASAHFSIAPPTSDHHDALSDVALTATTDAFTATCRVSVDETDTHSGGVAGVATSPSEGRTSSDTRDFIMHRFLPAAQTIACDSPQTPNRRPIGAANALHHHHHAATRSPLSNYLLASPPKRHRSASLHELFNDEDDLHPTFHQQKGACGLFSFCFPNAFLHFDRSFPSSSSTSSSPPCFKSPRHKTNSGLTLRPSKLADILRDNAASFDDDQDVAGQVQANAQQKRVLRQVMSSPARALATAARSPHHQLNEVCTPNYYDPSSRFTPPVGSPTLTLFPPLPKSPSESWLQRAIPLRAKTRLSPLSDSRQPSIMHANVPFDLSFRDDSLEATKWEAIVKGSHVQPGHLRFSEELIHQSDNPMKVGAF